MNRRLRNDNRTSRLKKLHFRNCTVVATKKKNSVLDDFPLCPQSPPPPQNRKFYFYCRLAISERIAPFRGERPPHLCEPWGVPLTLPAQKVEANLEGIASTPSRLMLLLLQPAFLARIKDGEREDPEEKVGHTPRGRSISPQGSVQKVWRFHTASMQP